MRTARANESIDDGGTLRTLRIIADSNRQARRPMRALIAAKVLPRLYLWCLKPAK
jgi:hypothetical protein